MSAITQLGKKVRELSPAAIREIMIIIIILFLSIAISIPQYVRDRERAEVQKKMQQETIIKE